MSTWRVHWIECPCGARFAASLADGVHVDAAPAVREQVLAGALHRAVCPGCGRAGTIDAEFIYADFARREWIVVAPPAEVGAWRRWAELTARLFDAHVTQAAVPEVRAAAAAFRVRTVFGVDALAERLRAFEARLDDRLIETLKLSLWRAGPTLSPGRRVRLVEVDRAAFVLRFAIDTPGAPTAVPLAVSLSLGAYAEAEVEAERLEHELPAFFAVPCGGYDVHFAAALARPWTAAPRLMIKGPVKAGGAEVRLA
ncbi:MAG: CpXC domain-containing protein [Myxococcales bacterium]|nr:CpXC domain-containing protein [Myxococcales bacterium]